MEYRWGEIRANWTQLAMATSEAQSGVAWLNGIASLKLPEEIIEDNDDRKVIQRYTPLGVVAAIVPWNFPIQLGILSSSFSCRKS